MLYNCGVANMKKVLKKIKFLISLLIKSINLKGGIFGYYIVKDHFYNAIPNFKKLLSDSSMFNYKYTPPGLELYIDKQLQLIKSLSQKSADFKVSDKEESGYYNLSNGIFGHDDSMVYFGMISFFKPSKIFEVGGGYSTLVALAARENLKKQNLPYPLITTVEPYPSEKLLEKENEITLLKQKVEEMPLDFFDQLDQGDILFIDSSHVIKTKNDVICLYLEILPRLKKGVIVHIHDISIPYEVHPAIFKATYCWNEQYLLQAMLTHSTRYEVLYSGYYITTDYFEEFHKCFHQAVKGVTGGSFYIKIRE